VTEDEIEFIAAEMAKAGGTAWYPGRDKGPLLRLVSDRYRDRARLMIAALDRYRAGRQDAAEDKDSSQPQADANPNSGADERVQVGSLIVYRPKGDHRAYPCRVQKLDGSRAYVVPEIPSCTGWVDVQELLPPEPKAISNS
jgi:hypothetical protein